MSIFSAASGGMHERKELRRGQRQQMAEAFAKFKASNPLATVADFQNFIDSFSGGNNYIAGGAPGESVLNRIAASNQAREAERQKKRAFEEYQKRRALEKDLTPEIEDFLIDLPMTKNQMGLPGYDYTKATEDFLSMRPELKDLGLNFNAMMTGESRDQAIANRVNQNLGLGKNYFETLPVGEFGTLEAFQTVTNLPKAVAEQVYGNLKTAKEQEVTQKVNEQIEKYSEKFNTLINTKNASGQYNTPAEAQAIIKSQMKNSPYKEKLEEGDWLTQIYNAGKERADQRVDEEKASDLATLSQILYAKDIRDTITDTIRSQGKEAAKEKILKMFGQTVAGEGWNNTIGKAELDKFLDNQIGTMVAVNQSTLDDTEWQRKQDLQKQLSANVNQMREDNQTAANELFKGGEGGSLANKISSMPTIVKNLGNKWFMDSRTKNLILTFAQSQENADVGKDVQALQDSLDTYLTNSGATPLSSAIEQANETASLRPLSRTTFTDYRKDLETHINNNQTSIIKEARKIVDDLSGSQDKAEYESAIRVLNGLKSQYGNWTKSLNKTIQRNFDDRRAWRDIDGKQYDKGVIDNLFNSAKDFSLEGIDRMLEDLKAQAEELLPTRDGNERTLEDDRTLNEQDIGKLKANTAFNKNKPIYEGIKVDAMDWNIVTGRTWGGLNSGQALIQKGIEDFFTHDEPRDIWRKLGLNANLEGVEFNYQDFVDTPIEWLLTNPKAKEIAKRIWGESRYKQIEDALIAQQ